MKRIALILALLAPALAFAAPPPGHPSPQQARDMLMPDKPPAPGDLPNRGKILGSIDANDFTYVEVAREDGGKEWIAAPKLALKVGSAIHLELSLGPVRQPWELTVIEVDAGRHFVDQQTGRGPMAYWRHTHAFEAVGDGTRVIDHIEYALPLGVLGRVAAALFGGLAMRMLFAVRRRKTAAWFA